MEERKENVNEEELDLNHLKKVRIEKLEALKSKRKRSIRNYKI